MAQIVLTDVAQLSPDDGLLSFHYCVECADLGFMAFGAADPHGPAGYDLRLFGRTSGLDSDGLGVVAKSGLPPHRVSLSAAEEIPGWEEYGDDLRNQIPRDASISKDDLDENVFPGLVHVRRSKVGGWPTWVQDPHWPSCDKSGEMMFVGQLDWDLGRNASWAAGGYAYLFVCPSICNRRKGDLVIQTT